MRMRRTALIVSFLGLLAPRAFAGAVDKEAKAIAIVRQAVLAYSSGDFAEAGRLFFDAYELSHRSTQLRNAAKAYEQAGRIHDALGLWQRYRSIEKSGAVEAEAHIELIRERERAQSEIERARLEAERARSDAERAKIEGARVSAEDTSPLRSVAAETPPSVAAPTIVRASPPEPDTPLAGYLTIGLGGALMASSVVVWLASDAALDDLHRKLAITDPVTGRTTGIAYSDVQPSVDAINRERVIAGVLGGVGLATAAAGVIWALAAPMSGEPRLDIGSGPSFAIGPRGAALTLPFR
jgi:hypothetical protein